MDIKKSIEESYIFNIFLFIKRLLDTSFIFNVKKENKDNANEISGEYKTWKEHSLIYALIIKLDKKLNKLEKFIHNSIIESKIYNILNRKNVDDREIKKSLNNPVIENSKVVLYFRKIKDKLRVEDVLIALTTGYIFVDIFIRRISFTSSFGSIWDELLLIFLFVYIFYSRIANNGDINFNLTPMGLPATIYIVLGIIHLIVVSPDLSVAVEGFRAVFQQVLWYFAITQFVRNQSDSNKVINIMIGMGLFLGIHATYQYIAKVPMPGNWVDISENVRTRAFSIVGSPNVLGALFVLFIPIGISMLLVNKNKNSRIFYMLSVLFMILGLFFTMSRGAWLAFGFSMFIFIMIINIKLLVPFIALVGVFILSGSSMAQRLLFMLSPSYMMSSAKGGRLYRWRIGIDIWKKNKFFGVGLGRFGGAVAINNKLSPFYLDNYYLKTLTEMGIYGILALAFVIVCFVLFSSKIIKYQNDMKSKLISIGLFTGGIGILTQNFVENIFEVPAMAIYFWVIIALINTFAPKKTILNK